MSHSLASLIGALAATTMLAWSGAASAETPAGANAALGSGYTAYDAPLGAPTELRIDLKGRVASRCDLVTPPTGLGRLPVTRAGESQAAFAIDCNAPFILRVQSANGGFAAVDPTPGIGGMVPYELAVAVETDAARHDLGWCESAALTDVAASACAFAGSAPQRGWSSGEETAIGRTGAIRLRWDDPSPEAPLLGAYRDTIIIELEVRS